MSAGKAIPLAAGWSHVYAWGNNEVRAALKGRRCRLLASGSLGTVLVQFEDGRLVATSGRALRRNPARLAARAEGDQP